MALNTWIARFVVDHGRVTEEGGRLRSFQRRRLDEPDVDLIVLQEPDGAKGEELGSQALEAIGRLFLQDRLSLTGALTRALNDTHQTLLDWNRRSVPQDQVGIGVVAALTGGNIVYLAQAGPGVAFLRHDGELTRLRPDELAATALGEGTLEPSVRRLELVEGDMVLGASAALDRLMDADVLKGLLSRPTDEALPELYLMTRDLPSFALFAITCLEDEEAPEPEAIEETPAPVFVETPVTAPMRPETPNVTQSGARLVQNSTWAPAANGNGNGAHAATEPPAPVLVQPVDISKPLVNLRNDRATGRGEYVRTTGVNRAFSLKISDWRLVQIAAVVAVVLIMIVFVPGLVRQGRSEKLGELVANAQANYSAAQGQQDPAQKRFYLEETRRLATEALRLDSVNQSAGDLQTQASAALQTMDAVFDLSPLTAITTLSQQITGEVSITELTVKGGVAYMLDSAGGRVISVPVGAAGQPSIVFQDGETYAGTPAKKPSHLVWEGDDSTGRLLILDEERKLFELHPGSAPAPLPLRKTSTWSSVAGLASYDGNLYVLDPVGSQVHRYLPAEDGFDSEPETLLSRETNLTDSVGFAVDGDIFVIYKNGKVGRFSNGQAAPFNLGGIDRPVSAAIDVAAVPSADEIYIADSGNKRVVVAGKNGDFHRQLVSNDITDLRAIAVDTSGAQLYLVVGDQLLTAPIVR